MALTREEMIAKHAEQLLADWNAQLKAGSARAIRDLQNTALDRLTENDAASIFIQALTDPAGAEARFGVLVAKAAFDVCEADAKRTVDLLMADLIESRNDDRIAAALDAKAA